MNLTNFLVRLLGYSDVTRIDSWRASFGARWAHDAPAWIWLGVMLLGALAFGYYFRFQRRIPLSSRVLLASFRGIALGLLLLILADPVLELNLTNSPKPLLWLVLDGSDSMNLADEYPSEERQSLAQSTALDQFFGRPVPNSQAVSRADYTRALLSKGQGQLLKDWSKHYRVQIYSADSADGVRGLAGQENASRDDAVAGAQWLGDWQTDGSVTALGNAFGDLQRRQSTSGLAAVVVISDFDQNAGAAPIESAKRLGVPVFTVGVGAKAARDLAVDLSVPPTMKMGEGSTVSVTIRQRELEQTPVKVHIYAQPTGNETQRIPVGEKSLTLTQGSTPVEFPFTPEKTGQFTFIAEVDPVAGELVTQNNRSEREVRIIDDFLRLMFVEYEPTWEWRFVKEVFHRDKLVGTRGFRTFLRSADPLVRETNELFLPSLTLPRAQFFENDVIFLGDLPASALTTRFCEMTREFVSQFGGGLVIVSGPRFGPGQLAETPLADMLPVVVDPDARPRDDKEFRLQLTPFAEQFDFMRLGQDAVESQKAWNNLGKLPWYQPVRRIEAKSTTVLAEHPTEFCADGKTKQPLIAVRKYGRGEVIYLGFNETWRLRRLYGEKYYRQFWGQLIHRVGLSHALGSHKRFIVRTDKQQYRADEKVILTVEAYDKDFNPLSEADLPERSLQAELQLPDRDGDGSSTQLLAIPQLKPGVFETRAAVFNGGEYRVKVTDPIAKESSDVTFTVTSVSAERRSAVRNVAMQQTIAAATGGRAYELTDLAKFTDDFSPPKITQHSLAIVPLWSTWLTFGLVLGLLFAEWLIRKLVNLA